MTRYIWDVLTGTTVSTGYVETRQPKVCHTITASGKKKCIILITFACDMSLTALYTEAHIDAVLCIGDILS